MNKKILAALMLIIVAGGFGVAGAMFSVPASTGEQTYDGVKYTTNVCSTVYRHNPDGTYTKEPSYCTHNTLTNAGRLMIINYLSGMGGAIQNSTTNVSLLVIGNGTAPVATDTALNSALNTCGLSNVTAVVNPTNATARDISWQWTNTCTNQIVNTTAIYNSTAAGPTGIGQVEFAGATLTSSTLQNTDKIQVNYTINIG